MRLPEGRLRRSRVVTDARPALADALEEGLTGYAVLEPRGALLFDAEGCGVVTFRDGVPVVCYHTGTGRGGPPALADLAAAGPYHLDLVSVSTEGLAPIHAHESYRVPPGMPAERLAGDRALAERTRAAAPNRRRASERDQVADERGQQGKTQSGSEPGAVEAFLENEEKIEAIREAAREEARERAEEWGFDVC